MCPKLTYLFIIIALLASSCNSDSIGDISLSKNAELSFNVTNAYDLSRSSVTNSINQFVIYGDMKSMAGDASDPNIIFNKKKVEFINDSWYYEGTQYWIPNYEYSFVALSPGSIIGLGDSPGYGYMNSKLSFEYSIPPSGNASDILIAAHRRRYVDTGSDATATNSINLTFTHLLSLINLAPSFDDNNMGTEDYLEFHKLEISGINTEARIDIQPAPLLNGNSTYDMSIDITEIAGKEKGNYTLEFPVPVKVENNANAVRLFADDDAIIMLPQSFTPDTEAEIMLSYTISGDTSMNYISLPLKDLKWETGRSYIYKFTLERSGVIFDSCEISPWNVITGEEITVE